MFPPNGIPFFRLAAVFGLLFHSFAASAPLFANTIEAEELFRSMAEDGSGFGAAGRVMKFLFDVRGNSVYFINANYELANGSVPDYVKYHYDFAVKVLNVSIGLDEFNRQTYFVENKTWYAGTMNSYEQKPGMPPLYAIQLYPDDVAYEDGILYLVVAIAAAFRIPNRPYAFVAAGPQQTCSTIGPQLNQLGYQAMNISELLAGVTYLPLNPGEAWGFLRLFPSNQHSLTPMDIPYFAELPLDLSVVAATITVAFQDVTSHVNLKSKERGTPNMMLRDPSLIDAYADMPIHLVVSRTNFSVTLSTAQEVEQKLKDRLATPWQWLPSAPYEKLVWFDDMCPVLNANCTGNGVIFGGKASMLGFLVRVFGRLEEKGSISSQLGYDLVPYGWGVPLSWYEDLVNNNTSLKSALSQLVSAAMNANADTNLTGLSQTVQSLFYHATVPPEQMSEMVAHVASLKGMVQQKLKKLKVRSSANAEDIIGFDGAGLHDSFGVKLKDKDLPDHSCKVVFKGGAITKLTVVPATLQCAMKASFASLWNVRAVEERTFSRIDHRSALMGLAIVPAYDTESSVAANGVIITRAINQRLMAYTVSVQQGNNLVTNPDPGTIAQSTIAVFSDLDRPPSLTVTRFAVPVANGTALSTSVISDAEMSLVVKLAMMVEISYCKAKSGYNTNVPCSYVAFDPDKTRSLDIEFKYLKNGQFVIKQAREFHGL